MTLRRERMVSLLKRRGITDSRVLDAMAAVPRELFIPDNVRQAYRDSALPIGRGQTISQPYVVARMTELLQVGHRCSKLRFPSPPEGR